MKFLLHVITILIKYYQAAEGQLALTKPHYSKAFRFLKLNPSYQRIFPDTIGKQTTVLWLSDLGANIKDSSESE